MFRVSVFICLYFNILYQFHFQLIQTNLAKVRGTRDKVAKGNENATKAGPDYYHICYSVICLYLWVNIKCLNRDVFRVQL